jgi:hypothetical protein
LFLATLAGMTITYLILAQIGVAIFFKPQGGRSLARTLGRYERRVSRRASRWNIWGHGTTPPRPRATRRRPSTGHA